MKVLILSITAGEGHNSTAKAIQAELTQRGIDSNVLDTYEYISPTLSKLVDDGYLAVSGHAKHAYENTYRLAEKRKRVIDDDLNLTRLANKPLSHKILGFIEGYDPDVIIYTHPFAGIILDILIAQGKIDVKTIGILTDFTFHPFWEECIRTNYVVTACEMLDHQARAKGFFDVQIKSTGIPIHPKFNVEIPQAEARAQLGLDINKRTVLLMGGSMGYGNMQKSVESLDGMRDDFQLIIVNGNNKTTRAKIGEMNLHKRVLNLGFVSNVDVLMDASDCIITKPGGLTTSEALAKRMPMIIVNPIPGQEYRNTEFLLNNGAAMATSDTVSLEEAMFQFMNNPTRLKNMREATEVIRRPNSTKDLCDLVEKCAEE